MDYSNGGGPAAALGRATPVHAIGDTHALAWNDLVMRAAGGTLFAARAHHVRGLTAGAFVDSAGNLHRGLVQVLADQRFLDESLQSFHLSKSELTKTLCRAEGRDPQAHCLVLFCGDLDLRSQFLPSLGAAAEFELPFEAPDAGRFPAIPGAKVHPTAAIVEAAARILRPLFSGLSHLVQMGFWNLFVHSIPPQIADDEAFQARHGFRSPALVRYKSVLLFNRMMAEFSAKCGVQFLDLWAEHSAGGSLVPEFDADGVHLNQKGAFVSFSRLIERLSDRPRLAARSRYEAAYREAAGRLLPDRIDPAVRAAFQAKPYRLLPSHPRLAEEISSGLDFSLDVGNRHARFDWMGNTIVPFSRHLRTAVPSVEVLRAIHEFVFSEPVAREIESCLGCEFNVLCIRTVMSIPHQEEGTGPQKFHHDGCPPGVLRALLYLTDVDPETGPFEFQEAGQIRSMTGPAGTFFLFDADRLLHRARPPATRTRKAIDFVIGPRIGGRPRRVLWAGMNSWPIDPYDHGTDGCVVYEGDGRSVATLAGASA